MNKQTGYMTREDLNEEIDFICGINLPKTTIGQIKYVFNRWLKKLKRNIKARL